MIGRIMNWVKHYTSMGCALTQKHVGRVTRKLFCFIVFNFMISVLNSDDHGKKFDLR